jgi:hypothetical protein
MNCEDVELELSSGEPSAEARAHLPACASCQESAKLLGLASLPAISQEEQLLLNGLASGTQQTWRAQHRRGEGFKRGLSLVLAAGVGALLASVLIEREVKVITPNPEVRTVMVTPPELPELALDTPNLSDDEVFFEVGWPSPTEGDL